MALRIFWYLIFRNITTMKEYIKYSNIILYLKRKQDEYNLDEQNKANIKEILRHFEAFGFQ